ncbi:enoyl-ACP reductase FabI [Egicoccus halophilus]|uniref:Enoyl-[acyl-carrier-protein] reductase [NADH] n=1 Tax=Egicoccus halophilus TaxID=1670830 RepID=A0A8J3A7Z8_9ACTN|nr:enoyl-ACP reductase FabI [Egicoccus halophilus]GGI06268.1 enoyl-[acyl-carrier-protein] reductase [NADH] [Egicoccus halophilus]
MSSHKGSVMLLAGKKLLLTGVLDPRSIAFAVAETALGEGAEVVLTGFGRTRRLTERSARRLPGDVEVLELDVTRPEDIAAAAEQVAERWGRLDGLLHAIGFAPASCLGGGFLDAPWEDVATALQVSTYSYPALANGFADLLGQAGGGSVVGLDFDAQVAWPGYDWMGVAKAGLESANRYLARELGARNIRVNLVAAGPLNTMAARSIDGFADFETVWKERAPLGWDLADPTPVARTVCALLSDWVVGVTGEILHVDGGLHAMGAGTPTAPAAELGSS